MSVIVELEEMNVEEMNVEEMNVEEMNVEAFGSTFPKVEFNASIVVTELLSKTLENCAKELASRCIKECALRHGFDASEEIRLLGLENLALIKKQMAKKSGPKIAVEKKPKAKGQKKSAFPLPFFASSVDFNKCNGLAYNRGLFTQCSKEQMANSCFCKGCQAECDASATGIPTCGTVQQRLATGLYEFKDTKGRNPISYRKVLEKAKFSVEQALEEAGKLNIEIDEEHFVLAAEKKTKPAAKGRPKKPLGLVEAEDVTDLFAKLTADGEQEEPTLEDEPMLKKTKKPALTDEEKAAKKEALEAERAAKKLEREAKLAADKEEREAKRKAELEQKKLEREAKIALEKAEREAKRLQEKEFAQQQREAKKALAEQEKKAAKKEVKKTDTKPAAVVAAAAPAVVAAAPAKVSVTRITIEGKQYLKSTTNILYNPETKEEIGLYDPETKTIKEFPAESDAEEESEDEYEEDEN